MQCHCVDILMMFITTQRFIAGIFALYLIISDVVVVVVPSMTVTVGRLIYSVTAFC